MDKKKIGIVLIIVILAIGGAGAYFLMSSDGGGTETTPSGTGEFELSDMSVTPSEVRVGEPVNISFTVKNVGGLKGTCSVKVAVNGIVEAREKVMLGKGGTEKISFTVTENGIKEFDVAVGISTHSGSQSQLDDKLTDAFIVKPPTEPFTGVVTLYPTDDSYVDSDSPDNNFGSSISLSVDFWDHEGVGEVRCNSYLKFDLSSIPSNSTVNSAKLKLRAEGVSQKTTVGAYYCSNDTWGEDEITWNNAPEFASTLTDTNTFAYAEWYSWDITSDVQFSLSKEEITTVLQVESTGDSFSTRYSSKEQTRYSYDPHGYSGPTSPVLIINYTYQPKN